MTSFEAARAKVLANSKSAKPPTALRWVPVSANKLVSSCGRYCLQRIGSDPDKYTFDVWLCHPKADYGTLIEENIATGDLAKARAQAHRNQGVLPL